MKFAGIELALPEQLDTVKKRHEFGSDLAHAIQELIMNTPRFESLFRDIIAEEPVYVTYRIFDGNGIDEGPDDLD